MKTSIETEIGHIEIREAVAEDAKKIIEYMNWVTGEVDFHTYGAGDFHISESDEAKVLELFHNRDNCMFLVAVFREEIIAVATLSGGVKERVEHRGNIGITVAKRFWRLSIGKTMMQIIINYAEENKTLTKLELLVHQDNIPAIKLYNRLGFFREGLLKRHFKIEGKYYAGIRMGLLVD
jgi:RimJ/RimL family protein N-acetyltransferase